MEAAVAKNAALYASVAAAATAMDAAVAAKDVALDADSGASFSSNTSSGTMFEAPSNAEDANVEVQNEEEHPEINIDLTETEVSGGLLYDDVINMVKEDIYKTFQHFMKDEGRSTCSKVKELILQTLKIVLCARAASEKTVKIDSSNNDYVSANGILDSDATVKVNSHGEPEDGETNIMPRKKRKLSDEEERSTKKERKISQQSTGSVGTHSKAQQHLVGDDQNACTQTSIPEFVQSKSFEFEETNKSIQKQKKSTNSIGATAASFDYMLCSKENPSTSFKQQAQGVTTSTHSFFGFTNNTSSQKEKQISDKLLESKMNLDMNKVFLPDDEIDHTQSCWAKYLDEARKKYFFYSDDIPTFRLFENNDDCGKEIT
ncbi:hypothetical protein ZWY2020_022624 [Hordeum vulgare]|nr:hypothetical protein ZWY2020_022624 [Hordeum vulgare]